MPVLSEKNLAVVTGGCSRKSSPRIVGDKLYCTVGAYAMVPLIAS